MGVYNNEIEQKKIANTERYYGQLEGKEATQQEIAKNLKNENVPIETIIKCTNLTKEEIEKL